MRHPFITYSLPHSTSWNTFQLGEHTGQSTVAVKPFVGKTLHFSGEKITSVALELRLDSASLVPKVEKTAYENLVSKAVAFCQTHHGKVILSRAADVAVSAVESRVYGWLDRLRAAFPGAFVYVLHTPEHGTWMGATPETLVSRSGEAFYTVALAGTRWGSDPFTEKEHREQEVVTEGILRDLELDRSHAGERHEVAYGAIRHLQTDIRWQAKDALLDVAEKLHPTAAVCGWPKHEARDFILANEPHQRGLYTGFIAVENSAFVNLRCMQLFRGLVRIYAGGGINALSDPATEWEETERKMRALTDAMGI